MIEGVNKLNNGAKTLDEGMNKFNDQAIQKIVEVFDGDASELMDRLKALSEASKEYNSYSGLSENMDGEVKFIFVIDGLSEDDIKSDKKSD